MENKARMDKTISTRDYAVFLQLLRKKREEAGITQIELAALLGQTQSAISKFERGERRVDILQLRTIISHYGITLPEFVLEFEKQVTKK
jgi:transcriptional regulator with XRE-family HTH domain